MDDYYISATLSGDFEDAVERVCGALKEQGFGVLTDIDVRATLAKKLGIDHNNYRILGACNPDFAYRALETEDKIGVMLPCNVIVREAEQGVIEVAAINPVVAMEAVQNPVLEDIAGTVLDRLVKVIDGIR